MTRTRAGRTPAKRAVGPSSRKRVNSVARVEGFRAGFSVAPPGPGSSSLDDSDCRAVMRVFTTQIGFVIRTVADPAMAPAIILSTVVSLEEARNFRMAARSKNARVHSYQ